MLESSGAPGNVRMYQTLLTVLGQAGKSWIIRKALADVKSAAASGKIKTTPGQYFYRW